MAVVAIEIALACLVSVLLLAHETYPTRAAGAPVLSPFQA